MTENIFANVDLKIY